MGDGEQAWGSGWVRRMCCSVSGLRDEQGGARLMLPLGG